MGFGRTIKNIGKKIKKIGKYAALGPAAPLAYVAGKKISSSIKGGAPPKDIQYPPGYQKYRDWLQNLAMDFESNVMGSPYMQDFFGYTPPGEYQLIDRDMVRQLLVGSRVNTNLLRQSLSARGLGGGSMVSGLASQARSNTLTGLLGAQYKARTESELMKQAWLQNKAKMLMAVQQMKGQMATLPMGLYGQELGLQNKLALARSEYRANMLSALGGGIGSLFGGVIRLLL